MTLPENFSPWEHLQSLLRLYHNKIVREEFKDISSDDDLSIPRGSLKLGCLLQDDDTVDMTILRFWLFFLHTRKASDFQAPLYGIPVSDFDERQKYRPQVTLFFIQDDETVVQRRSLSRAEISVRLTSETPQTLTESDLRAIANRIKTEFATAGGYRWQKGRVLVTYKSPSEGLNLQIYAFNEAEAREVIRKVCDVAQKPFNEENIVIHESKRNFPTNPGTQLIIGKQRQKPLERPQVRVRFRRATISVHGLPNPITLLARPWDAIEPVETFLW